MEWLRRTNVEVLAMIRCAAGTDTREPIADRPHVMRPAHRRKARRALIQALRADGFKTGPACILADRLIAEERARAKSDDQ